MSLAVSSLARRLAGGCTLVALAGCATMQAVSTSPLPMMVVPASPSSGLPAAAPAPATALAGAVPGAPAPTTSPTPQPPRPVPMVPAPPGPPAFSAVVKDAARIDGPITAWQKDDKVWLELGPDQFDKPMLLSPKLKTGIGEAFIYGGLMAYPVDGAGGQQVVEFVRVHNQVRLVAKNLNVRAHAGTPEALAVESTFSPSLLGSVPVLSQPHPERNTVLVEANPLFLTDMLGVGMQLQRAFRQGYSLDRANSVLTAVRGTPEVLVVETQNHFYAGSLNVGQPGMAGPSPGTPRFVPDTRSLFVSHHYSLAPLPAVPMAARRADARVGLFAHSVLDFSDDLLRTPRQRIVNRWRLDKKDPSAQMSEPVKPITFWIDRNVPVKYRAAITAGVLEWNRAFERIGFKDALVVKQQPDDATFDTLDFGVASVRWMVNPDPSFGAIGPRHIDPRTGEILDADIAIEGMSSRALRTIRSQLLAPSFAERPDPALGKLSHPSHPGHEHCLHGDFAAEQLGYALDVLDARGDLDPDGPQAQQFVLDYVKDVTMHEVGHTLGLRHNFRASRLYSEAQLSDPAFTRSNGMSGSVMEYNAVNLPRPGHSAGAPFQSTLGPYDYWAIEYAYRPLAPADEAAGLLRIASRSNEPELAFGTDEDNSLGTDPETLQGDLGDDPVAFAAKRLAIARDLFQRQETRPLKSDRDYSVLRRSLAYAFSDVGRAAQILTRQIGGVRAVRDFPGSGRDPLVPVDAATQRRALELLTTGVLSADGLRISPALQRKLGPDFFDRAELPGQVTDFSVSQRLLDLQRGLLFQLMGDAVSARLLDSADKFTNPADAVSIGEVHRRVGREVWTELAAASAPTTEISAPRRALQREHVNRLSELLLRPNAMGRADARSQVRSEAQTLLQRLSAAAAKRKGRDSATTSHLDDSADTLKQALGARLQRTGV